MQVQYICREQEPKDIPSEMSLFGSFGSGSCYSTVRFAGCSIPSVGSHPMKCTYDGHSKVNHHRDEVELPRYCRIYRIVRAVHFLSSSIVTRSANARKRVFDLFRKIEYSTTSAIIAIEPCRRNSFVLTQISGMITTLAQEPSVAYR